MANYLAMMEELRLPARPVLPGLLGAVRRWEQLLAELRVKNEREQRLHEWQRMKQARFEFRKKFSSLTKIERRQLRRLRKANKGRAKTLRLRAKGTKAVRKRQKERLKRVKSGLWRTAG